YCGTTSDMIRGRYLSYSPANRDLHSFPTRRSSDLYSFQAGTYGKDMTARTIQFQLSFIISDKLPIFHIRTPATAFTTCNRTPCIDRKSTRLNSSHVKISYAVFCLKKITYEH